MNGNFQIIFILFLFAGNMIINKKGELGLRSNLEKFKKH